MAQTAGQQVLMPGERPAASGPSWAVENPSLPYVIPFVAFMIFLAAADYLSVLGRWEYPVRVAALSAILFVCSRHVVDLRVRNPIGTAVLGIAVFAIWIAPDLLFNYREHWLLQNSVTGKVQSSIQPEFRNDALVLFFRVIRAAILVPIIEELFWRAWLMRWLISPDFRTVALGTYVPFAFFGTAVLFAVEHGPYWEVGLVAGLLYNWWMVRTRSLGDCILAHAITNAALCAFVIATGSWHYL